MGLQRKTSQEVSDRRVNHFKGDSGSSLGEGETTYQKEKTGPNPNEAL